jgi:hypothetical protein
MNGKRFWTVLTVAAALTLFSSFVFGQIQVPNDLPTWKDVASAASTQADKVTIQISTLEFIIETERSNPYPCERKAAFYKEALVDLQEAKTHTDNAYAFCQALSRARDDFNGRRLLLLVFSELSRAAEAFNNALAHYYDAHFVVC